VLLSFHALHRLQISKTGLKFLRVLYLTFSEYSEWENRLVEPRRFLLPLFTDISASNVFERVVISCTYNKNRGWCQPTWKTFLELKNILVKNRFQSLREVIFYARGMESWDVDHDNDLAYCIKGLIKQGIDAKSQSGVFFIVIFLLKSGTKRNPSKATKAMKLQAESLYLDSGHSLHWLVCVSTHNFAHLRKLSINMSDYLHDCSYHWTSRFLEHCSRFEPGCNRRPLRGCTHTTSTSMWQCPMTWALRFNNKRSNEESSFNHMI